MKLLCTIGWNSVVVTEVVRRLRPEKVVILYGYENEDNRKRVERSLKEAVDACEEEGITVETRFVNPLDFGDCLRVAGEYMDDETAVNFTGGTKVMALALALTALSAGAPLLYYEGKNGATVEVLPLQGMDLNRGLYTGSETQRKFVDMLLDRGRVMRKEAMRELGLKDSTISGLIDKFVKMNVVRKDRDSREVVVRPLPGIHILKGVRR